MNKILARIERQVGLPGLAAALGEKLNPSDLQSLLLEVFRLRASRRRPADLLADYKTNRFIRPSPISPTLLLDWERAAFASLPSDFQPLTLAPVGPLGAVSGLSPVDQNWAIATIRNTEVLSDSTNILALECARQRQQLLEKDRKSTESVHLAASHRLTRAQKFSDPQALAHFSLFGLCSAGRDQGGMVFERETLRRHITFYLRAILTFVKSDLSLEVVLTDFHEPVREAMLELMASQIREAFPQISVRFDPHREHSRGYYLDVCFKIHAPESDESIELADGGVVDWTQQLLSNAKERLVISGIGSERVCNLATVN